MEPLIEACFTIGLNPFLSIVSDRNSDALKYGDAFITFTTDTYLRGTNFENKIVIIDEAQNFYFDELRKHLPEFMIIVKLL